MSAPNVRLIDNKPSGVWTVVIHPVLPNDHTRRKEVDISRVRGIPTVINSVTFTEPFGPAEASLTFPAVSPLEPLGFGSQDLWWLQPDADVEIYWTPTDPVFLGWANWVNDASFADLEAYQGRRPLTALCWEGFVSGFDWRVGSGDSVTVTCTGAMRMLDYRVSKRITTAVPMPFEQALTKAFTDANAAHNTRLGPLNVHLLPSSPVYQNTRRFINGKWYDKKPWYMQPNGLQPGQRWSGLLTREMGNWGKLLSDYIAMLLKVMYTETGQYTLQLDPGRIPVLRHRNNTLQSIVTDGEYGGMLAGQRGEDYVQEWVKFNHPEDYVDYRRTLILDVTWPGVSLNINSDYAQAITTIYGNVATTLTGTTYNGMQFEGDGLAYWYEPFAKTPWVDPDQPNRNRTWSIRREIYDEFPDGLTPDEAQQQARRFLSINGSPGLVGNLTLDSVDPLVYTKNGEQITFPRQMVTADTVIRLDGFNGQRPGPLVYVNESVFNPEADSLNCQIDSKFRDFMTTAEVKIHGRDALLPNHTINVNTGFSMGVQEAILPWSYAKGCGYFPWISHAMWKESYPNGNEPEFYEGWLEMIQQEQNWPKNRPNMYSMIRANPEGRGTKNNPIDATYFWNVRHKNVTTHNSKVLLSQSGTIMSSQFICVDERGNLMPVSFHVSVWNRRDANANNTPRIPSNEDIFPGNVVLQPVTKKNGKVEYMYVDKNGTRYYKKTSRYPFYEHAWFAQDDTTGKKTDDMGVSPEDISAIMYGVGNYYDRPGFFPGSMRNGDAPTGIFTDNTEWGYSLVNEPSYTDLYSAKLDYMQIALCPVLIFCDDMPDRDLYFIGRFIKKPEEGIAK